MGYDVTITQVVGVTVECADFFDTKNAPDLKPCCSEWTDRPDLQFCPKCGTDMRRIVEKRVPNYVGRSLNLREHRKDKYSWITVISDTLPHHFVIKETRTMSRIWVLGYKLDETQIIRGSYLPKPLEISEINAAIVIFKDKLSELPGVWDVKFYTCVYDSV